MISVYLLLDCIDFLSCSIIRNFYLKIFCSFSPKLYFCKTNKNQNKKDDEKNLVFSGFACAADFYVGLR